jgi:hypothetical protein
LRSAPRPITLIAGVTALAVTALTTAGIAAPSAATPPGASPTQPDTGRHIQLWDGSTVTLGPGGIGTRTRPGDQQPTPVSMVLPQVHSPLGDTGPSDLAIRTEFAQRDHSGTTSDVVVGLTQAVADGAPLGRGTQAHASGARAPHTTSATVNAALRKAGATSLVPLFAGESPAAMAPLNRAVEAPLGAHAVDLGRVYVVHVSGTSAAQAAAVLGRTAGVGYAEPDRYVSPMDANPTPIPSWVGQTASPGAAGKHSSAPSSASSSPAQAGAAPGTAAATALPSNYGLQTSTQSYLNANGVDFTSGYAAITSRLHQLPGTGERITNVSIGDLTDQAMADAGDGFVQRFGPTTVVEGGQRYLDYPSLPKIPTYTVSPDGAVDPLGTVEGVDPSLGEVLLDFSVMAPLPHDQQRPDEQGSGLTDLLGIAPGASYRLVEPSQPTYANIAAALLAAAQQTPRPNVITASLGFGTDVSGFPGRYLEDDPLIQSVVASIVHRYGITVTLSSNDGTRTYTNAAVGPDGGSTPTDRARPGQAGTTIADDAASTTPSQVPDTGAIAVGGTTLDDTLAVPTQDGGRLSRTGTFAETRLDGAAGFSSGFGSRVDVSAPSDNIAAFLHECPDPFHCGSSDAIPVLNGGTSASAPMTAAVVADLLQVAKATGHALTPEAVRRLLEQTGRAVPTQPQVDRHLHVGPQVDLGHAVDKLFSDQAGDRATDPTSYRNVHSGSPSIVRVSVAHRVAFGGAGADFTETTDPAAIDLAGPGTGTDQTGEGLVGPITFGVDATGVSPDRHLRYEVTVNGHHFISPTPAVRVLPTRLLKAAGLPVVSDSDRTVTATVQIRTPKGRVLDSTHQRLTLGPTDGTHAMAPAPVAPPVAALGKPVKVSYDLKGVRDVSDPTLLVSSIGHWSPFAAPQYNIGYSVPLTATKGIVTVPASAFSAGGGMYGLAVSQKNVPNLHYVGAATAIRIARVTPGGTADNAADRPAAPTLAPAGGTFGHVAEVTRADSGFDVRWDARAVPDATGVNVEISAPGPTIYNLSNTFTNTNGTTRDANGVDTGSVALLHESGTTGTVHLDAKALGLSSSLTYTIRILARRGTHEVGQASPVSTLAFDDGLVPGGGVLTGFDIHPGGASTAATTVIDGNWNMTHSTVRDYAPDSGAYGKAYATDTSGNTGYLLFGSDQSDQRLLAASIAGGDSTEEHLLTFDTSDGHQVADVPMGDADGNNIVAGRVDDQRHRGALLAWQGPGASAVLPVDTGTGQVGTPVPLASASRGIANRMLDIDSSTGKVIVGGSNLSDNCAIYRSAFTTVDLDAGTASPSTSEERCATGLVSDQDGSATMTIGPLINMRIFLANAQDARIDETDGTAGDVQPMGAESPIYPAVDPVHHLLVVGFLGGQDWAVNNNAMSAIGVYDLQTGQRLSLTEDANLFGGTLGSVLFSVADRGIQLDPATRTGYTYGPGATQVQQFHY